ncbi:MAG: glycosyltransferase family 4 protein [Planctomycetes bacterium]|nr:glycosyltransferase family 4 protein [Planctomycetota bacterium]
MRIAVLIYTYSETHGGAERACSYLTRGLLARGHEVHLFARRFHRGAAPAGAILHEVPVTEAFSAWRYLAFAANVKALIEKGDFDVVHSFTRTTSQDVLRLGGGTHREYLRRMAPTRSLVGRLWARINPKELVQLRLEKLGFRPGAYRRIVAVSERVKEEVVRAYGVPSGDIVVIPNGVDTQRFTPALREHRPRVRRIFGIPDADPVFLFCGNGARRKGLAFAIEAVARLRGARLMVVGDAGAEYRSLARRLGIAERVYLLGHRDAVGEYYGAADALVLPTFYDPFPNVCLEAIASGLPVITTAVTGVAEVLTDGRDSFIVPDGGDVDAMAARMSELADPARREEMSRAARETAERYTIDRMVEANLAVYEEVLRIKGATAPAPRADPAAGP